MSAPSVDDIVAALDGARRTPGGWQAQCPAHTDHTPSLSIEDHGGKVLVHCHAGCSQSAVIAALRKLGVWSAAKVKANGKIHPREYQGHAPLREHAHADEAGETVFIEAKYPEPIGFRPWSKVGDRWECNASRRIPYRLRELLNGHDGLLIATEGAKDADTIASLGFTATSFKHWSPKWNHYVARFDIVAAIADDDLNGAGDRQVNSWSPGREVLRFSTSEIGVGGKDVSDLCAAVGIERLRQAINGLLADADPFEQRTPQPAVEVASEPDEPPELSVWIPDAFWASRRWLQDIHAWCLSRGYSPDTTLVACLARYSAFLPKGTYLDSGVENPRTSLNLLVNLLGPPGCGKSGSLSAARMIVPRPSDAYEGPLGSGEGLAEAFMATVKDPEDKRAPAVHKQIRHNAFLSLDEGQTLRKLEERKGSTILQELRKLFSGEALGQSNASNDRKRNVEEYHSGIAIGWQPHTIRWLFDDVDCGTPQRFLYVRCNPRKRPEAGSAVAMPQWTIPPAHMLITFCDRVKKEVADDFYSEERDRDEYDIRTMQIRLKIAAIIACLETHQLVTEDEWELAGIICETSRRARLWAHGLVEEANAQRKAEAIASRVVAAEATMVAGRNAETTAAADEARVTAYVRKHPKCSRSQVRKCSFNARRREEAAYPTINRMIAKETLMERDGRLFLP